jgi:hypothetical protein
MNNLASEFQAVSRIYRQLEEELAGFWGATDSEDSRALAESILRNRDCLARIEQMSSRILGLSNEWKKRRDDLDAESRQEIDGLSDSLREQIVRLNQLCGIRAQKLQAARDKMGRELSELGKGDRYLKSVKAGKNNYPKFIDSLY